ncbi:ribonuclease Y [Patescibacteria group bacterium]|nr:ribonuclease Y [Patescibacteria group bacterium]MBU1966744.1 ribonuclease Y [Patescibacteria group bacterium]MBU2543092.1 ribonuclease Y [Patescibacteria group bacterium]
MSFFSNLSTLFGTQALQNTKLSRSKPKPQPKIRPQASPQKNQIQPKLVAPPIDTQAIINGAQTKAREIIVEAKDEALTIKTEAENNARGLSIKLEGQQQSLDAKLSKIEERLSSIESKEERLDITKQELEKTKQKLTDREQEILAKLEATSGMTTQEATKQLFDDLEKRLRKEMAQLIRQKEEEAQQEADSKVQEIIIDSMRHGATDYVAEYTISTVELPSEEVKGKIIGKSGRNIHTFEKRTGVDVDLDADPQTVRLSCFDPVRREIARISLERLIKDGRIQPTRIEEIIGKVEQEIDKVTFEAGKKLCHEIGVYNLPNDLMKMIGKFKYRFSYGQNLIAHTLEETRIGIKLAHELGIDVNIVKLGCLLHDIGKVSDEVEGSHVELGIKIAKKYNMPQEVIDCIAQHHEDKPFSGPEQMAVYIADAISGARPGARYENYEEYVKRLEKLEEIANKYDEVEDSYAIQAGREIRVLLKPEQSKDDDVTVLASKIRDEIKDSVTYPGTVTVTVIRETRSQAIAK